jgi:CheY-like chemotaxis protein
MKKRAILCVDDEKTVLDTMKEQLKTCFGDRYIYEFAESVEEAWEVIDEWNREGVRICLIVSDWLMPGIKGDEFLINVHERFPDIVKIMLTGQADIHSIQKAKDFADLHCCLYKPWDEEELIEKIRDGMESICNNR